MTFLELTGGFSVSDRKEFLVMEKICFIESATLFVSKKNCREANFFETMFGRCYPQSGSLITLENSNFEIFVKETPNQIKELIKKAKKAWEC